MTRLNLSLLVLLCCLLPLPGASREVERPAGPGFVATADPVLACALALEATWSLLDRGDPHRARQTLDDALGTAECRQVSPPVEQEYLQGRFSLLVGEPAAALEALQRARGSPAVSPGDRPSEAEILYYLGLAHQRAGNPEQALAIYEELSSRFPADARVALLLPSLSRTPASSPSERLQAAVHAVDSHNYSAAERFLTSILSEAMARRVEPDHPQFVTALYQALTDDSGDLGEAAYQLGYLWYYWLRTKNSQAVPLLSAVANSDHLRRDDAAYYLARSYMRAEDYDAAREAWAAFADRFRRDRRRHEATYYQGWLYMDRERFEEALPAFVAYLERYPRGERADRALWYLGWSNYRLGRYPEARESFHRLARRGGYLLGAKGQYWEARCFQEEGDHEQAEQIFAQTAERYGFTYYGLLAHRRLGEPLVPPRTHRPPMDVLQRLNQLAADIPELATLAGLIENDLYYRALRYYERQDLDEEATDWLDQLFIRHAVGDAYQGWRQARRRVRSDLRQPPTERTMRGWVVSYPRPYYRWVMGAGNEFDVDPLLIWSHMQIESHYHPGFVSYADAQGVLQIIPKTGQYIAAALEEPYTEGILMNPPVNLRYAAWYLAALIREFEGTLPLAMAAYNSGAHAMHGWVDENSDLPFDAFIEEIAYDQSREYVKRVIGIYVRYLYLYADDEILEETLSRLIPVDFEPGYLDRIDW